jgi:Spy/CpxP family protein refolding chaperone
MVVLPGIAFAASQGFSQTTDAVAASSSKATISHKALAHYSSAKSFFTIPKSAAKQAKYTNFLTNYLSLLPSQKLQTASIFASASASKAELKTSIKAARKTLGESVRKNDVAGISKTSAAIGTLVAQRHSIGANANAAFLQLLTADQQAKLSQLTT